MSFHKVKTFNIKVLDRFVLIGHLSGIRNRYTRHFPQDIGYRLVCLRKERAYIVVDGVAVRIDFLRLDHNFFQFDGAVFHNDFIVACAVRHCNLRRSNLDTRRFENEAVALAFH